MTWEITPWQLFLLGGPLMWPLLLCSVMVMAVVLEKWFLFIRLEENTVLLKDRLLAAVRRNDIKEALALCEASGSPAANVFKAGLLSYGSPRETLVRAMDEAGRYEVPFLESRLTLLATLAQVMSLLGLLGTATGMMMSFHALQMRAAALNPLMPGDVAGGLWTALITTATGLTLAIPALAAHNYFSERTRRYVARTEKDATEFATLLTQAVPLSSQGEE